MTPARASVATSPVAAVDGDGQRAAEPAAALGARQQAIVRRAAELFDSAGYSRTSMNDLAEAVGLAKPTLYHYFRSKDEILYRIHCEFIGLLLERQEARAAAGAPPVEQLRGVMGDILELMETHRGHVRVFFEHHRELPERWKLAVAEQRQRYSEMVEQILRDGVAAGDLAAVDVRLTALAMFGMCNWAYQWFRVDGALRPRALADHLCDTLLDGIATRRKVGTVPSG